MMKLRRETPVDKMLSHRLQSWSGHGYRIWGNEIRERVVVMKAYWLSMNKHVNFSYLHRMICWVGGISHKNFNGKSFIFVFFNIRYPLLACKQYPFIASDVQAFDHNPVEHDEKEMTLHQLRICAGHYHPLFNTSI